MESSLRVLHKVDLVVIFWGTKLKIHKKVLVNRVAMVVEVHTTKVLFGMVGWDHCSWVSIQTMADLDNLSLRTKHLLVGHNLIRNLMEVEGHNLWMDYMMMPSVGMAMILVVNMGLVVCMNFWLVHNFLVARTSRMLMVLGNSVGN